MDNRLGNANPLTESLRQLADKDVTLFLQVTALYSGIYLTRAIAGTP